MSEMTTTTVGGTYAKIVDTAVESFVAQNTGPGRLEGVFTEGSAPTEATIGFFIEAGQAFTRDHGTGHLYCRAVEQDTRITVSA